MISSDAAYNERDIPPGVGCAYCSHPHLCDVSKESSMTTQGMMCCVFFLWRSRWQKPPIPLNGTSWSGRCLVLAFRCALVSLALSTQGLAKTYDTTGDAGAETVIITGVDWATASIQDNGEAISAPKKDSGLSSIERLGVWKGKVTPSGGCKNSYGDPCRHTRYGY